jgi:cell division transport system permease protein
MRLLDRINRTGTTVLMATHDRSIVDMMRERVIELDRGIDRPRPDPRRLRVAMAFKVDYVVRETTTNLRRNLTLTPASVLTVAVSLTLFGVGPVLRSGRGQRHERWQGGIEFIVFMNPEPPGADRRGRSASSARTRRCPRRRSSTRTRPTRSSSGCSRTRPSWSRLLPRGSCPPRSGWSRHQDDAAVIDALGKAVQGKPGVYSVQFAKDTIDKLQRLTEVPPDRLA